MERHRSRQLQSRRIRTIGLVIPTGWELGTRRRDTARTRKPGRSVPATRLQVSGLRFYIPELGRWINRDPAAELGGLNQFASSGNDPVRHVDSLGLWKKVGGTIYEAERDEEGLEELAFQVSWDPRNWVCIWPVPDSKKWANYRRAKKCAKADVSNLVATSGHSLRMMPTVTTSDSFLVAVKLVIGPLDYEWTFGLDAALRLRDISESGSSPIRRLYLGGHGLKSSSGIGPQSSCHDLRPDMLEAAAHVGAKVNTENTYPNAIQGVGPPKCWFTRDARVYGIGCNTFGGFSSGWASKVMREPSEVYGTLNYVYGHTTSPSGPYLRMARFWGLGLGIYDEYGPKAYGLAGVVSLLEWGMVRGTQ